MAFGAALGATTTAGFFFGGGGCWAIAGATSNTDRKTNVIAWEIMGRITRAHRQAKQAHPGPARPRNPLSSRHDRPHRRATGSPVRGLSVPPPRSARRGEAVDRG